MTSITEGIKMRASFRDSNSYSIKMMNYKMNSSTHNIMIRDSNKKSAKKEFKNFSMKQKTFIRKSCKNRIKDYNNKKIVIQITIIKIQTNKISEKGMDQFI